MIDFTPDSIAIHLGPIPVFWYGIAYALGLVAAWTVMSAEVRRKGQNPDVLANGIIIIAVAALIGGRLYHVIDQWRLYRDDPMKIVLPPYTGLGVYGGIIAGTLAAVILARLWRIRFWIWADIVAPGLFAMQAVARWGNFFNQELYGPRTNLPWGIAIQCQHRIPAYACPPGSDPTATLGQHFQPLFLYESLSGLLGMLALLWLARRLASRLRPGDLLAVFFVWYGIVRFLLEFLRADNWTFNGIATAQIFSVLSIAAGLAILAWNHRAPGPSTAEVDAAERERLAAGAAAAAGGEATHEGTLDEGLDLAAEGGADLGAPSDTGFPPA